jgi:hypothetical protein
VATHAPGLAEAGAAAAGTASRQASSRRRMAYPREQWTVGDQRSRGAPP